MYKQRQGKRLGEDICNLILGGNKSNLELFSSHTFTNKVKIHLNMLRSRVEDWVQ
jgi:hypothetical protein